MNIDLPADDVLEHCEALGIDADTAMALIARLASHTHTLKYAGDVGNLVLVEGLVAITRGLNDLVGACLDGDGRPGASDLIKARALLPERFSNSFHRRR